MGDASKAKEKLRWTPEISFADMIAEMVEFDLMEARKTILLRNIVSVEEFV